MYSSASYLNSNDSSNPNASSNVSASSINNTTTKAITDSATTTTTTPINVNSNRRTESSASMRSTNSNVNDRTMVLLKKGEKLTTVILVSSLITMILKYIKYSLSLYTPEFLVMCDIFQALLIICLLMFYILRIYSSFDGHIFGGTNRLFNFYLFLLTILIFLFIVLLLIQYGAFKDIRYEDGIYVYSDTAADAMVGISIVIALVYWIEALLICYQFNNNLFKVIIMQHKLKFTSNTDIRMINMPNISYDEKPDATVDVNSVNWDDTDMMLLNQITKQSLLVCFCVFESIIYWIAFLVYCYFISSVTNETIVLNLRYLVCFLENIFYLIIGLSLWLSFAFADKTYKKLCFFCHGECLHLFQRIATKKISQMRQDTMRKSQLKQPLIADL